ncbi:unnamed protein product [Caenorhabditis brenneri]
MGRKNKKKNRKAASTVEKKRAITPENSALHSLLEQSVLAPVWKLRYQWLDAYIYFVKSMLYGRDVSQHELAVLKNAREFTSQYLQFDPRLGITDNLDSPKTEATENLEEDGTWENWKDLKVVFMHALGQAETMNLELDRIIDLVAVKDEDLNCEGFFLSHVPNLENLAKRHNNHIMKHIHLLKVPDFTKTNSLPIEVTYQEPGRSSLGQDTDKHENQVYTLELVKNEIEKLVTLFGINQLGLRLEFFVFFQYIAANDLECWRTVDVVKYLQHLEKKLSNFYDFQLIDLLNRIERFFDNFAVTVTKPSAQTRMKRLKNDIDILREQNSSEKKMLMMTRNFSIFEDFELNSAIPNIEEELDSPLATFTCLKQISNPEEGNISWINFLLESRLKAYSTEAQNLRNLKVAVAILAKEIEVQRTNTEYLLAKTISMIEASALEESEKQKIMNHFENLQSFYSYYMAQYAEELKENLVVAEEEKRLQKMAKEIGMFNDFEIKQEEILSKSEWDEFMIADDTEQLEMSKTEEEKQVDEYIVKYVSCITSVANFCCNTWPSYVRRCQDFIDNECVVKRYYNTETIGAIENLAKFVNRWQKAIHGYNGLAKITDPEQIVTVSAKSLEWIYKNEPNEPYIWDYHKRARFSSEIGELHELMKETLRILSHGIAHAVETLQECSEFEFSELNIAHLCVLDHKMLDAFLWNYPMLSKLPEDDLDLVALNNAMRGCVVRVDNKLFERHYSALSLLMQFWENTMGSTKNKPETAVVSILITNLVECEKFNKNGVQELINSIIQSLQTSKSNSFRTDKQVFKKTIKLFMEDILWLSVETRNLDKYTTLKNNFGRILNPNKISIKVAKNTLILKREEEPSNHHEDPNRSISFRTLTPTKHRRRIK